MCRTKIGKSLLQNAGLGLFNISPIKENQLIMPYYGEIIDGQETDRRDDLQEIDEMMFLFKIHDKVV